MRIENQPHKKRSVLVFLPAQDFNEHEFLIISSHLEKAAYQKFIVSDSSFLCVGSNGLKVKNDVQLCNANQSNFAGFIIVGGSGTRNYWNNSILQNLAKKFTSQNKPVGAICCAPIVLAKAGLLTETATCFKDDRKSLEREGIKYQDLPVVKVSKIVTGQDPASSVEFIDTFLNELSR
jgi:protease I